MAKNAPEGLMQFIQYCADLEDAVMIVEGKNDRITLQQIGILNSIIVKGGRSVDDVVDLIHERKRVIILTDFDKEGKKLRMEFKRRIQRYRGLIVDSYARQVLYKLCRANRITEIEDLDRLV